MCDAACTLRGLRWYCGEAVPPAASPIAVDSTPPAASAHFRFGTHFGPWPDKYMPKQHEINDDVIRFFALNIEDTEQCLKVYVLG